ncbi:hypothetical protein ACIF8T_06755 [Streptomyces sp. NPDC085946]|uniref:hypothetical protein n=1 Tax=Streptomyces sp. NPDC085946 TaxID=3365744 RepID=UPI0037CD42F5
MRGRRCSARGRAGSAWRGRPPAGVRLGAAAVLLGTAAVLPGQPAEAAAAARTPEAADYAFAEGAQRIEGARGTDEAALLEAGRTYRSSLPPTGAVYYRLELDDVSNTYVSATAVPGPDSSVSVVDGLEVSVEDADGTSCSLDTARFGAARSPHPIAAWGVREISPARSLCQEAGTYYVSVERSDPEGEGSSPDTWDLELSAVSEPRLAKAGGTSAPREWNSASPRPLPGTGERRPGGAGFSRATPLGEGVWRDDIRPGRTLFYEVPVDWGQQLHVTAGLGSTGSDGTGYVPGALDVALYNPARGRVADVGVGYDGKQKSDSLPPLPPVGHVNRYATAGQVGAMRFAGSYYLVVHLAEGVAGRFGDGPFGLTLRVRVSGAAQAGPDYAGESVPEGVFEVTDREREVAAEGAAAADDAVMTAIAVGGIGTGSVLLAGLGVWTVVARRRAAA